MIQEIARTDMPVVISGESGSGKEVTAWRLHGFSHRWREQFVKVISATLSPDTFARHLDGNGGLNLDSELYAGGGSLFFDEVSELDSACQLLLLYALPEGDALSGGARLRGRVICASRRDLQEQVRIGAFREELYYRLSAAHLQVPPLRERREDIAGLVNFFTDKYSLQFGREKVSVSARTLRKLQMHSWPGNVRQLENVIKRIVALGDEGMALEGILSSGQSGQDVGGSTGTMSLKQAARKASRNAERGLILKALERTRWNRKKAAMELQISYKALLYKLKQIGLDESSDSFEGIGKSS